MITKQPSLWLLPVLAFCSFLVGYDSIGTVPLLPDIAATTDMPLQSGGLLYVSYAIAYAITAPITGMLSDRWNRKGILMIGMGVFGISTAFVGTGDTFAALIWFRILSGVGAGMIEPIVYAIAGDSYTYEQRGRAMGMITAALISSSVLGIPLAGFIAEISSWHRVFWFIAILAVFALIAIIKTVPYEKHVNAAPNLLNQLKFALSHSSVLFSLLGSFLYYGALQGMFVLAGVFYFTFYDLGSAETGVILMAAGASSVIGSLWGGKWADKWKKKGVVSIASVLSAFFVFSLGMFTSSLWISVILHVLWAALYTAGQSAFTALISELDPKSRGTVMSLNSSAMYIGAGALSALAAALLGAGSDSFWTIGLMCGTANLLVTMIVIFAIRERSNANL